MSTDVSINHPLVFESMWVGVCGYAAIRGGPPERLAAASIFTAGIATIVCIALRPADRSAYSVVEAGIALTDLSLFLAIVAIAITSTRFWPMLMASMMGCGLFGHLTKPLGPDILPKAYYIAVAFWAYPQLWLLAIGTWRHRRRLKRYGVDYAWVWKLPQRYRNGWSVDELARPLPQR